LKDAGFEPKTNYPTVLGESFVVFFPLGMWWDNTLPMTINTSNILPALSFMVSQLCFV